MEIDKNYLVKWVPKCRGDFSLFCDKLLGIKLNNGQVRLDKEINSSGFFPVRLMLCGNRFGKTVFLALKHIYKAFYKELGPGLSLGEKDWQFLEYVTLNVAPSSENTKIMLETILSILRGEFPIKNADGTYSPNESKLKYFIDIKGLNNYKKVPDQGPYTLRYANNSKSRFFTLGQTHGDTIQGRSYMFGSYDEFGRSKRPEKEIDDILTRMMQFRGELYIITTPDMDNEEAVAYLLEKKEYATSEGSLWQFLTGQTLENEYIDKTDLNNALAGMSTERKNQILKGEISLVGATYYDLLKVNKMFLNEIPYETPQFGQTYSIGLDTAGSGRDYWAVTVVKTSCWPFKIVHRYYDNKKQPLENMAITKNIFDNFIRIATKANVEITMDYTNEAGAVYYGDMHEYYPRRYRFGTAKKTGKSTKAELTDTLRRCINDEGLVSPKNSMLKNQLVTYKGPNDDDKQTTDALMSLALAVYQPYQNRVYGNDIICLTV